MDNARIRRVPIARVAIHKNAKAAFRFTQGLNPQCDISLLKSCSTGTWSTCVPRAIKIDKSYHVFSGWHGLLYAGAIEQQISVIIQPELESYQITHEAWRFAIGALAFQSDKAKHPAYLAELAKICPLVNSARFLTRRFETPRAFSYSFAPIDPKSVDTQLSKLLTSRLQPLEGKQ
ncbi:MAG: hypothetical protein HLX52_03845 [Idiomarinaceae bacterium]|uniref:hypothetical protein n=1 Tax=Idiomarina sp. 28-8 TaxID=1260624 RepID=UPI00055696A6|nr:hypothetical protein [Idiomarina sp. 28-8]NWO02078.1 hypothetical protein [Idiomarinaceae bacterium]